MKETDNRRTNLKHNVRWLEYHEETPVGKGIKSLFDRVPKEVLSIKLSSKTMASCHTLFSLVDALLPYLKHRRGSHATSSHTPMPVYVPGPDLNPSHTLSGLPEVPSTPKTFLNLIPPALAVGGDGMGKLLDRNLEADTLPVQIPALWEDEVTEGPFPSHLKPRSSWYTYEAGLSSSHFLSCVGPLSLRCLLLEGARPPLTTPPTRLKCPFTKAAFPYPD